MSLAQKGRGGEVSSADYHRLMLVAILLFAAMGSVGGIMLLRRFRAWRRSRNAAIDHDNEVDLPTGGDGSYDFSYMREMKPAEELGSLLSEILGLFFGRVFPLWSVLGALLALMLSAGVLYLLAFFVKCIIRGFANIHWL